MRKLLTTVLLVYVISYCYSQKEEYYGKIKDSILNGDKYCLKNKPSYIFSCYNENCILVSGKKVFYFKDYKNNVKDSLINSEIGNGFLREKLKPGGQIKEILTDSSYGGYNGMGNVYYFEAENGQIIFNFYRPMSKFWSIPKYGKFIQSLYGLFAYFYAKNL